MKRELDLVRKILMDIESVESFQRGHLILDEEDYPDESSQQLQYHLFLMNEAGLLEGYEANRGTIMEFQPTRLTWSGHEFLDSARNESIWNKATTGLKGGLTSIPFAVLSSLLTKYVSA